MKGKVSTLLMLLLAAPLTGFAAEQLIPAGSLLSCTVAEPKLSSKTANIGDPVLCKVSHVELYGRSTLPYESYMVGRFEDYKDPGHFVGKGWMELKFDRLVIQPDTVIPVDARVVAVPGYNVDRQGRILGKGHPVRDIVEWSIPILWPIDLINLPRRGPRPVLKEETRLTLKIMDDLGVPTREPYREPYQEESPGLLRRPSAYRTAASAATAASTGRADVCPAGVSATTGCVYPAGICAGSSCVLPVCSAAAAAGVLRASSNGPGGKSLLGAILPTSRTNV